MGEIAAANQLTPAVSSPPSARRAAVLATLKSVHATPVFLYKMIYKMRMFSAYQPVFDQILGLNAMIMHCSLCIVLLLLYLITQDYPSPFYMTRMQLLHLRLPLTVLLVI